MASKVALLAISGVQIASSVRAKSQGWSILMRTSIFARNNGTRNSNLEIDKHHSTFYPTESGSVFLYPTGQCLFAFRVTD